MKWRIRSVGIVCAMAGLVLAGVFAGEEPVAAQSKRTLVMVDWMGGLWNQAVQDVVVKAFEEKYDVKVVRTPLPGFAEMIAKARAEKGNPTFDLFGTGAGFEVVVADEGLVEPLDPAKIPNLRHVHKDLVYKNSVVANSVNGVGIAYHKNRVPRTPNSWLDFWSPEFKLVAISDIRDSYGRAFFARVNDLAGGSKTDQEPAWKRFRDLVTTKKPIINFTTDDTMNAIVVRGAAMSVASNSRAVQMMKEGYPLGFVYPKEGAVGWGTYLAIPVGAKNKDLAMQFINFWLDPDIQARFAVTTNYGPANTTTVVPSDYKYTEYMMTGETLKKAHLLDYSYLNRNMWQWNERWTKEILPLLNR